MDARVKPAHDVLRVPSAVSSYRVEVTATRP